MAFRHQMSSGYQNTQGLSGAEYLASIYGTEKDKVNCSFYFKVLKFICNSDETRKTLSFKGWSL